MKKSLWIIAIAAALGVEVAQAQCTPATPEQNADYEKVVNALQNQFKNHPPTGDWRIFDERSSLGKLQLSDEYGKIFRVCDDRYDLVWQRAGAAQQQKARADSSTAIGDTLTQQQHSMVMSTDSIYQKANVSAEAQSTVDINVEMNVSNYRLQEPLSNRIMASSKNITVKGAPMALQVTLKPDQSGVTPRPETVVFLGNWKNNLRTDSENNKLYHYSYSKGGSMIENLVITIKGPLDMANSIVQKVDWQALAKTLNR